MSYAICFDYPEADEPVFAGLAGDTFGFAPTLKTAIRFDTEEAAAQALENCYGEGSRPFGTVVEVVSA